MRHALFQVIGFLLFSFQTFAQDFSFEWNSCPSFGAHYTVLIQRESEKGKVTITNSWDKKTYKGKVSKDYGNKLYNFLKNYDYVTKGSSEFKGTIRTYIDTEVLADTNWVLVKGDSIRKQSLWGFGYFFDYDSSKCYSELNRFVCWTDGTTYEGKFISGELIKQYSIYDARITTKDFELNQIISEIFKKIDRKNELEDLLNQIETDKPR